MRPDLQELEITLGELKRLTGLKCSSYSLPNGRKNIWIHKYSKSMMDFNSASCGIFGMIGIFLVISYAFNKDISAVMIGLGMIIYAIVFGILQLPYKADYSAFIKEVNEFYQLILNINTLDELEAVGNPVKLNEREKVLEALRINRENLVRALQTERILRENPRFRPEQFNIDLSGLRSLQATEKATEYGKFLNEDLQIGVSVQTEMRKLENKRLGL